MAEFKLTEQQKRFFDDFGFLKFEGLFDDMIADITDEFEAVFDKFGGNYRGQPHNFRKGSVIVGFLGHSELLASLLDDHRVQSILTGLLGEDYNYLTSAGNRYVGSTGWHSDTEMDHKWPGDLKSLNLSFVLDPTSPETGALRIIPGSHYVGDKYTEMLKEHVGSMKEDTVEALWGIKRDEVPSIPISTRPGDLLVFNNYLKHATFGGGNNRRVMLTNFSKRYPDEYLDELRRYISTFAQFWIEELHGEAVLANPNRMPHLRQIQEHQGHLAEEARKAKAAALESEKNN